MTGNGSGMTYNIYFFLCCSFCSSQACIVTMPNVYFEEHELAHCPWCGSGMVRSTVEVLCMDCSIFFTERIHPSCVWKDQISSSMVSVCDKKDSGDSAYEHSDIGTNYSRATYTGERLVFADTSGSSTPSFQKEQQLVKAAVVDHQRPPGEVHRPRVGIAAILVALQQMPYFEPKRLGKSLAPRNLDDICPAYSQDPPILNHIFTGTIRVLSCH